VTGGRSIGPVLAGCALMVVSFALLTHVGFWKHGQRVDTGYYLDYGTRVVHGQVPYRDFSLEYPPAALPVFILPALGHPKTETAYRFPFEWLMAACAVATLVLVDVTLRALGSSDRARLAVLAIIGISPLLLGPVVLTRYDFWPALLSVAAVAAYVRDRSLLGGALLGIAVAAKVYPAAMAPVAVAFVWQRHGRTPALRSLAAIAAAFAVCVVPFLVLAPRGTLHPFGLELHRPLEVESIGGALLLAAHHLFGLRLGLLLTYRSSGLGGASGTLVGAVSTLVELGALLWIWISCARSRLGPSGFVTGAVAAVTVIVAFGKVFSPQYLIWLVPLVALVDPGVRGVAIGLLVAACALTQSWYPRHADALLVYFRSPESWALLLRDLIVVALAVLLVRAVVRPGTRGSPARTRPA
jgi:uncharacterized membrane protein